MNDQIKDSFVVVSDFHGADWVMDKIRSHYINEYEKIFNLGDIIDRGEQPFKLLLDYMEYQEIMIVLYMVHICLQMKNNVPIIEPH